MSTSPQPVTHPLGLTCAAILGVVQDEEAPDLSLRQVAVLAHIASRPSSESGVRHMAAALNVSKPAVTRAMDRLEELLFATRVLDQADRRGCICRITPQGRAWLRRLTAPEAASLQSAA